MTVMPVWFQQDNALKAYHDYLAFASQPANFDENAAGPIMSFVYVGAIGLQILALQLCYTKAPAHNKWPAHWKNSSFQSLWHVHQSSSVKTHTEAVEIFGKTAPYGTRHVQGTTTLRNDLETMKAAYTVFCEATTKVKGIKGMVWAFTFQAILPGWMNKGDPNIFGLEGVKEPLIIIGFSVTWTRSENDEFVRAVVRETLEKIEGEAAARKGGHPWRFINYAMEWQRPYDGIGEENKRLMKDTSLEYDPEGLFQRACAGGFKLDFTED